MLMNVNKIEPNNKKKTVYRLDLVKVARLVSIVSYFALGLALFTSCDMETVPCERCAQNYDRDGVFIGETCWQVPCCEVYYPYDCDNQFLKTKTKTEVILI